MKEWKDKFSQIKETSGTIFYPFHFYSYSMSNVSTEPDQVRWLQWNCTVPGLKIDP